MLDRSQQYQILETYVDFLSDENVKLLHDMYYGHEFVVVDDLEFRSARLPSIMARLDTTSNVMLMLDKLAAAVLASLAALVGKEGGLIVPTAVNIVLSNLDVDDRDRVLNMLLHTAMLIELDHGFMIRHAVCVSIREYFRVPFCMSELRHGNGAETTEPPKLVNERGVPPKSKDPLAVVKQAADPSYRKQLGDDAIRLIYELLMAGGAMAASQIMEKGTPSLIRRPSIKVEWMVPAARLLATEGLLYPVRLRNERILFYLAGEVAAVLLVPLCFNSLGLGQRELTAVNGITGSEAAHTTLVADMTAFMAAIVTGRISPTQKFTMNRQGMKRALKRMSLPVDRYLDFVQFLVEELNLTEVDEYSGRYELSDFGRKWLRLPHHAQVATAITSWMGATRWCEFMPTPREFPSYAADVEKTVVLRNITCWEILDGTSSQITTAANLCDYLAWRLPGMRHVTQHHEAHSPSAIQRFCDTIMTECMHWLGLINSVKVKLDPTDPAVPKITVTGYTIGEHGRLLLDASMESSHEAPVIATEGPCILQANGEVILPPNCSAGRLYSLLLFCDRRADSSMLHLTRSSVRLAISLGMSVEAIFGILKACGVTNVPQPITFLIEELSNQLNHCRVGTASTYISTNNEQTIIDLLKSHEIDQFAPVKVAPTVIMLQSGTVNEAIKVLAKRGLVPRNDDEALLEYSYSELC